MKPPKFGAFFEYSDIKGGSAMLSLTKKVEASKGDVINVNVKMSQGTIDPIDPKDASIALGIENHAKVDAESVG